MQRCISQQITPEVYVQVQRHPNCEGFDAVFGGLYTLSLTMLVCTTKRPHLPPGASPGGDDCPHLRVSLFWPQAILLPIVTRNDSGKADAYWESHNWEHYMEQSSPSFRVQKLYIILYFINQLNFFQFYSAWPSQKKPRSPNCRGILCSVTMYFLFRVGFLENPFPATHHEMIF